GRGKVELVGESPAILGHQRVCGAGLSVECVGRETGECLGDQVVAESDGVYAVSQLSRFEMTTDLVRRLVGIARRGAAQDARCVECVALNASPADAARLENRPILALPFETKGAQPFLALGGVECVIQDIKGVIAVNV